MRKKMIQGPVRILMVFHSASLTGPNKASLSLLKSVDKSKYKITVACPPKGYFVDYLNDIGVEHIPLEFSQGGDIFTLIRLISILRKNRYHVLHGHLGRTGPLICLAGKVCNVPVTILTEHMNDASHSWIEKDAIKLFFHKLWHTASNNLLDKVIAVSEDTRKNYIKRQGINEKKVAVIYNSVYLGESIQPGRSKEMSSRESIGFNRDDIVIGMVGRLVKGKGYDDVIAASRAIVTYNPRVKFLVVGDGPEMGNLKALARHSGIEDRIKFLGFRADADDLIKIVDLLIQPSHNAPPESFGMVLIEAMASRVPVISSDIAPFKEIVENGINGLLFKKGNPADIAEKVISLLENRNLTNDLVRRGYDTVKEKFSSQKIAKETCDVYKKTLLSKRYLSEA